MAAQNRQIAGQVTVTSSGTAVQGPDIAAWKPAEQGGGFFLFALSTNTGACYVGNNGEGTISAGNGYELAAGGNQIFVQANNLNEVWFDAATNGNKVCWLKS